MKRNILVILSALLGACATTQSTTPLDPPATTPIPAPAEKADKAPPLVVPSPPPKKCAVIDVDKNKAQTVARRAVRLLEIGREGEAKVDLLEALGIDPCNPLAINLMQQISVDPNTELGTAFFNYTVRKDDSLSEIAMRFLGDKYKFYILARYNDIRVPKDLSAGQTIKIPGKAPPEVLASKPEKVRDKKAEPRSLPPAPPPVPSPPPATQASTPSPSELSYQSGMQLLKTGNKEKANWEFAQATRLDPKHPDASTKANQLKKGLIEEYRKVAIDAYHRQDMDTAIKYSNKVLELDPGNESAKFEKQRAEELKRRAEELKQRTEKSKQK